MEENLILERRESQEIVLINKKRDDEISSLKYKKILGYIFLSVVIAITVLSSILIKSLSTQVKPFFLTYINYCFLTLLIPIHAIKEKIIGIKRKEVETDYENIKKDCTNDTFSETYIQLNQKNLEKNFKKFHIICITLMVFWYFGNAFYNVGLSMTSISSANTLSNSSAIFILLINFIFKRTCSIIRVLAIILITAGGVLMAFFQRQSKEKDDGKDSIMGDIYLIIGALFYSFYALILKYYAKRYRRKFDMMEIFGYIGFYNMLFIPFYLIFLNMLGLESFIWPDGKQMLFIFLNAVVSGMLSDLLQSYSITLLSPHIVSFGLAFTIPISYTNDILADNIKFNVFYLIGSICIFAAFVFIFYESYKKYLKKKEKLLQRRIKLKNESENNSYMDKTTN
jgi:drug/metabolite transporter (DMT)-like permease